MVRIKITSATERNTIYISYVFHLHMLNFPVYYCYTYIKMLKCARLSHENDAEKHKSVCALFEVYEITKYLISVL